MGEQNQELTTSAPSRWLMIAVFFGLAALAQAQCNLQLTSAGPCLADGSPGTPRVGDAYALKITMNVVGTPSQPFRIKWTMANVTTYFDNQTLPPGYGYWSWFFCGINLDDAIPWSVTLDPDGVTGDTNLADNVASGTFTPIPPATAVELYAPRVMHGWEDFSLDFQPGSGTIGNLWVLLGQPTSHGGQKVLSVTAPQSGRVVVTPPHALPIYEIAKTNVPAGVFRDTNFFTVQLSKMRVNPTLLRAGTWADMNALSTNWTQWLAPDSACQSTNPDIINFVKQSLPTNYQAVLTPYDTARTLHLAVMKVLTVSASPPFGDAVNVLHDGRADCGGFSSLLTASLRAAGIPARSICGFWPGSSAWHVRVEFHLPGVEWLVADANIGKGADPTGTYAYGFGYAPEANGYVAVDVGGSHILPYGEFGGIQGANWWWTGGAIFNAYSSDSLLQPNGVLCLTNSTQSTLRLCLSDVPTAGSVILQTSTNMVSWSAVATNLARGANIDYSFPTTNGPRRFYRANVLP